MKKRTQQWLTSALFYERSCSMFKSTEKITQRIKKTPDN